jgi:tRNA dimethylallyltransferase
LSTQGEAHQTAAAVIVGPTAVGKTDIAIQVSERIGAEIISADSRLFYRGMDIGTAKPSMADRQRVPHHLIDILDPDQDYSLAAYQQDVRAAIKKIIANGHLPLLVGGTGQYIRAVTESWNVPAIQPNLNLRSALEHWAEVIGKDGLHARLAILDPQAAASIDWRNLRRTIRALEVIFTSGVRFSAQKKRFPQMTHNLQIGLIRPRAELYQRIDERIDAMLAAGFLVEVQDLLARGYSPDLPAFSAIGYREMAAVVQDKMTVDEAAALIKRKTRIFVRRQANWFKLDNPQIFWFPATPDIVDRVSAAILTWKQGESREV